MEVSITSRQTIKPFSEQVHLLKPFKLSFLDQLIPPHYYPLVYFYTQPFDCPFNTAQISQQLKRSLAQCLNNFYPLSGRVINNLRIDHFEDGVVFNEAKIHGSLSDYLQNMELDALNKFLPFQAFCHLTDTTLPLLAVQLNMFDCGGIALAMCCSHKIIDASTLSSFLKNWTAFFRGSSYEISHPNLIEASSQLFPACVPPNYSPLINGLWFSERRRKTRRFFFDENAICSLKSKVKSENLEHPTRFQALSAFIWKYAMLASKSASGIFKPSVLANTVNIRPRMESKLPDYSMGNIFWLTFTPYNSTEKDIELQHLAYLLKEAVGNFNRNFLNPLLGEKGFQVISEQLKMLAEFASQGNGELYFFTSWLNFGLDEVDFGWGKPTWFEVPGVDHCPSINNFIIFKEIGQQKGAIEAWIALNEKDMVILEKDPEFLTFASPNYMHD
ncbi:Transferase [Corchorus olitorius]|uniref:Transferase n=1 Tax=Corchorus olitorius TaxID=93759 RepID=A0A1R3HEM6_9ROSI|nr:Transferase [Corchorus olitorius]